MRRAVVSMMVVGVVGGGVPLVSAAPASADEWLQAIVRPAEDSQCPENSDEENAAGWPTWQPSYEMWPFGGRGWWVCERTIDWESGTQGGISPASTQALVTGNSPAHLYYPDWLGHGSWYPDW